MYQAQQWVAGDFNWMEIVIFTNGHSQRVRLVAI